MVPNIQPLSLHIKRRLRGRAWIRDVRAAGRDADLTECPSLSHEKLPKSTCVVQGISGLSSDVDAVNPVQT